MSRVSGDVGLGFEDKGCREGLSQGPVDLH